MNGIFSLENPFWVFIGKVGDVCWLCLLWLVCSIPIVTIGASTTALYYVSLKMMRNEEGYITKQFFHSFRQNLFQGSVLGVIMILVGAGLVFNFWFYNQMEGNFSVVMHGVMLMLLWFYLMIYQYVFAALAQFENTIKGIVTFSLLLALKKLGWTVLMIVMGIVLVAAGCFLFLPFLIFAVPLLAFCASPILNRLFKPYMEAAPAEAKAGEDAGESSLKKEESN